MALERRLDALALTDHDSTEGLPEALAAAQGTTLAVLPGVEIAAFQADPTAPHGGHTVDILGYLFDADHQPLQATLRAIRQARLSRAARMVQKLNALGLAITYERVREIAGSGAVARPHVAMALREAGYVTTLQEAFDRYIDERGPAYVDRYRLTPPEAIALLHAAGGVAVLAHPYRVPHCQTLIADYAAQGLDGLEVYYPDHTPDFTRRMRVLARRYGLIMTGGSDFHRAVDGMIGLGRQRVPPACVAQLMARAAEYRR